MGWFKTVAIAISSDVFTKLDTVGEVGGIVGASALDTKTYQFAHFGVRCGRKWLVSFYRRAREYRDSVENNEATQKVGNQEKAREKRRAEGEDVPQEEQKPHHNYTLMMRILGPIMTFVNRPWKMYPVGVLFGFGFDTASSVALLALSAIAKRTGDGKSIPSSHIVILPLLFTAGMSLVDSVDSILMLYSYSGFPEHSWALFERKRTAPTSLSDTVPELGGGKAVPPQSENPAHVHASAAKHPDAEKDTARPDVDKEVDTSTAEPDGKVARDIVVKMNVMSGLSIILTLMSILVAFSISLITIMGLIGDQCRQCRDAAEAEDGGGLAGSWWRGWARAGDNSGYIGAAIVGGFVAIVAGWYATRWVIRTRMASKVRT
ncbi:hypothetical protein H0H81_003242 [Sphagnurus paluster]|uniref:Nickel/cobalt efflux system n=1 Tax=Sphagnurus paluster TaxID=117069 RepID=A0A9P7GN50_9AGAR|nr:hypothetical protein H0H81_003242 [Sphagnurus paluster]